MSLLANFEKSYKLSCILIPKLCWTVRHNISPLSQNINFLILRATSDSNYSGRIINVRVLSSISKGERYVTSNIHTWILIVVTSAKKGENAAGNDLFHDALMTLPLSSFSVTTVVMRARDADTSQPTLFAIWKPAMYRIY